MSMRVRVWGALDDGHIVETHIDKTLPGVLYVNGEKGEEQIVWLSHHVLLKNGKGRDVIRIPYIERHNEKVDGGIKTVSEEKILELPVEYNLRVDKLGEVAYIERRTGATRQERIHRIVNGEDIVSEETWNALADEQKKLLSRVDVWDVYDELLEFLNTPVKKRKPSAFIGALQQIYNATIFRNPNHYTKLVPVVEKIPTHKLIHCDVTLSVKVGDKYTKEFRFTEGNYIDCKNVPQRIFAFELPRVEIFEKALGGKFTVTKARR